LGGGWRQGAVVEAGEGGGGGGRVRAVVGRRGRTLKEAASEEREALQLLSCADAEAASGEARLLAPSTVVGSYRVPTANTLWPAHIVGARWSSFHCNCSLVHLRSCR